MACIRERRGRLVIDFYDQHGKRRWKTLKEGTTQRDARRALRDIEDKVEKGSYISPSQVPGFSKVAEDWLKVKKPDIRHTYASLLIDQGEKPKYIQEQLGHSSINITFDIYGHLIDDSNQEAATRLGNAVFGTGSKTVANENSQK